MSIRRRLLIQMMLLKIKHYRGQAAIRKVATVDNTGKVTAIGGGTTTITVKSQNGKEASCEIHVLSYIGIRYIK